VELEAHPYFLRTERLGFRCWSPGDLALAMGLWSDPLVTRRIDSRGRLPAAAVAERLQAEITMNEQHGIQYWPIFALATDEHVGCCGLRPYDPLERIHEFGVHIRSACWGRGYAHEASRAVIDHAFDHLGARGLFAGHHPGNDASRRLLEKLGFRHTHDEFYPPTGLLHPSYSLAPDAR
jgi:RimJ/RimL family protein N-acetyltransferase